MLKKIALYWTMINCVLFSSVYGYIDPGTGSMILGSLWSYIAVLLAIVGGIIGRFFIGPIKKVLSKLKYYLKGDLSE
jgi:hypothetical protein